MINSEGYLPSKTEFLNKILGELLCLIPCAGDFSLTDIVFVLLGNNPILVRIA
ncbi:MAG: hypothetical protein V3U88_01125 [Methylococcales bacterium]